MPALTLTLRASLLLALLSAASLRQAAPARAQSEAVAVGRTAGSHMHTLLQKTILKVDVLTVDLCFDEETGRRIAVLAGRGRITGAGADSITRAALAGRVAQGRVEFLRDIALGDFLAGVEEDLRHAVRMRLLPDTTYRALSAGLPTWYARLQRRGIRKGDVLVYDLAPDAVRTVLRSVEGEVLLDRTEQGRARRNSPLAAWLAPGSAFRDGLLESLRRERPRTPARCGFS